LQITHPARCRTALSSIRPVAVALWRRPVLEHVEALFDAHARDGVFAMP
jgi:hypothetical protein